MTEQRKRNQDGDREERRAQDRERLKDAAEQLLSSEGWKRWVRVRAQGGLARLSVLIWSPRCRLRAAAPFRRR